MFDFNSLINGTFQSTSPIYIITKNGSYVDGIYVETESTKTPMFGSCQTMSGNDLKLLPENMRVDASRQLFTTTEIFVNDDIEYKSERYRVMLVERYDDIGNAHHYKAILRRYDNSNEKPTQGVYR